MPRPTRHPVRWLAALAASAFPIVFVLVAVSGAAAVASVSASVVASGSRVAVRGSVRLAGGGRTPRVTSWTVALEQQGAHGAWTELASAPLTVRGRSQSFTLAWSAPASSTVLVVRVAVLDARSLITSTQPQRVVITQAKPVAPAGPRCGGEVPPPKPGGGSWSCTFDDEFDASTGDAHALNRSWWIPQDTNNSLYETGELPILVSVCYQDSPQTISVANGVLQLTVRKAPSPLVCGGLLTDYIGGMVSTYKRFNQQYGRFEVRAKIPAATTRGLQETLWLWPVNPTLYGAWPRSGEIDFAEFFSNEPGLDIPYIHYDFDGRTANSTVGTNAATALNGCPINQGQFNDYAVTWTPGNVTITVNGATCLNDNYVPNGGLSAPAPFNQPFFIALTQALGFGANAFNPIQTPLPATTYVDYVRVWQ